MTACVAWSGFSLCSALITDKSAYTVIITASITMDGMIRVGVLMCTKHQRRVTCHDIYSVVLCVAPDHPELHAQVPAQVPHSAGQRHPEAPVQHLQDLRVP